MAVYNRNGFNSSPFNVLGNDLDLTVNLSITLNTQGAGYLAFSAPLSTAVLSFSALTKATRKLFPVVSTAHIVFDCAGKSMRRLFSIDTTANIIVNVGGADIIRLMNSPQSISGIILTLDGQAARRYFTNSNTATVELTLWGVYHNKITAVSIPAVIELTATGKAYARITGVTKNADMILNTAANIEMSGYSTIDVSQLVLPVGSTLVIDTEQMTVMLDDMNVTKYFSDDSEFFKFAPNDNVVIYEDGVQNRNAEIKIIWKDRYL